MQSILQTQVLVGRIHDGNKEALNQLMKMVGRQTLLEQVSNLRATSSDAAEVDTAEDSHLEPPPQATEVKCESDKHATVTLS